MGLMSIDKTKLEIVRMIGSTSEAEAASTIIPILRNHHILLVTLLLFNALANEAMPVFLEKIVPPYIAVILSVSLVLIFGEIIPSALFTGRNQISLAARLSPFVWFLLYTLYPITLPVSKVLDSIFGHEEDRLFSRNELEALVVLQNESCREEYQRTETHNDTSPSELSRDEIGILTGVLRLSRLTASDAMIPFGEVTMISSTAILDQTTLEKMLSIGYSRYPVYETNNRYFILGYILVKSLIVINPLEKREVSSLKLLEPIVVHPSEDLLDMLNIFQEGKSHIALVSEDPETTLRCIQEKVPPVSTKSKVLGIVTLEDIIEDIIQEKIYDETDHSKLHDPQFLANPSTPYGEITPLLSRIAHKSSEHAPTNGLRKRKQSLSVRPVYDDEIERELPPPQCPPRIKRYSTFDSIRHLKKSTKKHNNIAIDITFGAVNGESTLIDENQV